MVPSSWRLPLPSYTVTQALILVGYGNRFRRSDEGFYKTFR